MALLEWGELLRLMAHKAHHGFKMRILFFDPYIKGEDLKNIEANACDSVDNLLSNSDFVSLHCPSTKETQGLINYDTLKNEEKCIPNKYCQRRYCC